MSKVPPQFFSHDFDKTVIHVTANMLLRNQLLAVVRPHFDSQVTVNDWHVKDLAANFRPNSVQALSLVEFEGRTAVTKGTHRFLMLKELGIVWWPAVVSHGLTRKEVHRQIVDINARRRQTSQKDMFNANRKAEDPDHVAVCKVVAEKYLFHIPTFKNEASKPSTIKAYRSLLEALEVSGGQKGLDRTFAILTRCFVVNEYTNELQREGGENDFIVGLAGFSSRVGASIGPVVKRFKAIGLQAAEVINEATLRNRAAGTSNRLALRKRIADVLVEAYAEDDWKFHTA